MSLPIETNDGRLPLDARKVPMQAPSCAKTSYLNKSPMTVSSGELDLIIPENAVSVTIQASGADLRVATGLGGTAAGGTYFKILNGTSFPWACSLLPKLYLLRDASTDVTVTFVFNQTGW